MILKSPIFVPFGVHLIQIRVKSDFPVITGQAITREVAPAISVLLGYTSILCNLPWEFGLIGIKIDVVFPLK